MRLRNSHLVMTFGKRLIHNRKENFPMTKIAGSKATRRPNLLGRHGAGEGIRTLDINLGKVALYP